MTTQWKKRAILLGVVGGIASGKSHATAEFAAQGAAVFDADAEVRALYEDPNVVAKIRRRWANVVSSDGKIDRRELAKIVFTPSEKGQEELATLNSIVHPALFEKFRQWFEELHDKEIAVVDAPLLFEVGWQKHVDYVIFVDANLETRLKRASERGWSSQELAFREARQLPLDLKRNQADFIVESNDGDRALSGQIASILNKIREKQT